MENSGLWDPDIHDKSSFVFVSNQDTETIMGFNITGQPLKNTDRNDLYQCTHEAAKIKN